MRHGIIVASAGLALFAAAVGEASGSPEEVLAQAAEKARGGDASGAATLYGAAIAEAQSDGDLVGEQEAAEAFLEFLARESRKLKGQSFSRELVAAAMGKLDGKRCGAFVSAPSLAGELLFASVAGGDAEFVAQAAAVLEPHARSPKSGLGLATMVRFGRALRAVRGEAPAAADAELQAVLDTATQQEWTDLGMAAGVELAALRLKAGDREKATEAVAALAALATPKTEQRFVRWAAAAVEARLKEAPVEVLAPWRSAMGYLGRGGAASGRGGAGGAGGAGGGKATMSPVGKALLKYPAGKALLTVARTKSGFELRVSWDPKFCGVQQRQEGTKYLDEGGATVGFADWSVGLRMIDASGGHGQPGESSEVEPGRAYYRLAKGETWALTKDGMVQITGK